MQIKTLAALAAMLALGSVSAAQTAPSTAGAGLAANSMVAKAMAACSPSSASLQQLAAVYSTHDRNFHCLGVILAPSAGVQAVRFETHEFETRDGTLRAKPVRVKDFGPEVIASARGAVLDGQPGHDAVILQGRLPAAMDDAVLVVKYLHNGITGEFRKCQVRLDKGPDAAWRLLNAQNENVSLILVKTWALPLVGTAGIDTLQGICGTT